MSWMQHTVAPGPADAGNGDPGRAGQAARDCVARRWTSTSCS
jgi:hypothetical protein